MTNPEKTIRANLPAMSRLMRATVFANADEAALIEVADDNASKPVDLLTA